MKCENCKIIELAMLVVEDGQIIEEYDEFINVGEPLSEKIISLTGISDEDLINDGVGEDEVARDLKKWILPETVMIAHNTQFDLSFVYQLLKRQLPDEADAIVSNALWIDTLTVLKDRKKYPHKLIDAVDHYGVEKVHFHRAIDDTKALYRVTQKIISERNDLDEYINLFGYNPKYGVDGFKFSFITYKPQPYQNWGLLPYDRILPKK